MSENLPLIDMSFALSQLSGNRALVDQLFTRFSQDYKDVSVRLGQQLPNVDAASAKALVHTIKGVAGNLGLKRLHVAAKTLEDAIKTNQDINARKDEFDQVMASTLNEIRQLTAGDAPPPPSVSTSQSNDHASAKRELKNMLERHEFITAEKVRSLMTQLPGSAAQKQRLEIAINDLDYNTAATLLDEL
ncbi:Hpt domain-containing protein [Aestuariibacter salexigens]|uniref:Hpt domain-containing protein n=1 Tax=Aestuariibacter salexigens TaxID=226010 RepID=UPI00041704C8|nr:Hpt domain-containing protein [Aestuariibacter salexigens]